MTLMDFRAVKSSIACINIKYIQIPRLFCSVYCILLHIYHFVVVNVFIKFICQNYLLADFIYAMASEKLDQQDTFLIYLCFLKDLISYCCISLIRWFMHLRLLHNLKFLLIFFIKEFLIKEAVLLFRLRVPVRRYFTWL